MSDPVPGSAACDADLGAMRLGGPRLRCTNARPCVDHPDSLLADLPRTWEPRYRLAAVLCNTTTAHASIRDDGDYCTDCLSQADVILEDEGCMEIVRQL